MTFEPVDYGDDEYETAATRPRPRRPRSAFWGRFWRSLTGQRDLVPTAVLDAAYRERAHLVALLAAWQVSHIGHTDPSAPDWAVVTIELPTGQACWHIAPADMDLFAHVQPTNRICRGWDGHTTEEKYARIDAFAAQLAEGPF